MKHGEWKQVEVSIKRWHEKKVRFEKKGGWYTRVWLMAERHWTKCLISINLTYHRPGVFSH